MISKILDSEEFYSLQKFKIREMRCNVNATNHSVFLH